MRSHYFPMGSLFQDGPRLPGGATFTPDQQKMLSCAIEAEARHACAYMCHRDIYICPQSSMEGNTEKFLSMAIMESSRSVSSRESLYSVESEEEDEDQQRCGEFEVFLSDSGSDTEKEPVRTGEGSFLFSPRSRSGRTNPALLCPERRSRKPAKPQPLSPCCRYPVAVAEGEYCKRLTNTEQPVANPKRLEVGSGRKRSSGALGGGRPFGAQLSTQGKKRQRNEETEDRERFCSPCWTEKDHIFAQKCWELQGFVRPLMELLHRLRMGRLNRGLSSFQQSVAMDRIQRIIGVLQKPEMGERYLGTLLQVERMLKVWFPHVLKDSDVNNSIEEEAEERCKMAKSSMAKNVKDNTGWKRVQDSRESPPTEELLQTHLTDSDSPGHEAREEPPRFQGDWPAMNLTWIHTSPISNPPLAQAGATFGPAFLHPPTQAYGVVVFLPDPSGAFARATSLASVPSCCHSEVPLPGSGGPPRCQSMPSAARPVGCCPGGGTLSRLSRSLPNLPASSTVLKELTKSPRLCTS
nr:circadian-associated transcriptional repressor isoform X2 [Anolis sagrei ordinatus]